MAQSSAPRPTPTLLGVGGMIHLETGRLGREVAGLCTILTATSFRKGNSPRHKLLVIKTA